MPLDFKRRRLTLAEVHREEVEALCRAAAELDDLEPWDALVTWLRRFVDYIATKLAFADALNRANDSIQACRRAMRDAGTLLLERAQRAGAASPEVSIDDILRMITGISIVEYVDDAQRERVLELAFAGLRAAPVRPPQMLPENGKHREISAN